MKYKYKTELAIIYISKFEQIYNLNHLILCYYRLIGHLKGYL